jgi:hypothetical protein
MFSASAVLTFDSILSSVYVGWFFAIYSELIILFSGGTFFLPFFLTTPFHQCVYMESQGVCSFTLVLLVS